MIYFVDEDEGQLETYRFELEMRSHPVTWLTDAHSAYAILTRLSVDHTELVLIDLMLRPGLDAAERYPHSRTMDGLLTGARLLEDLCGLPHLREIFPARAVLLTYAMDDGLLAKARDLISPLGQVEIWRKADFLDGFDFGAKVDEYLSKKRRRRA